MKRFGFASPAKVKFARLTVLGAVLVASMCLAGTARADSVTGAYYDQYLGSYNSLLPSNYGNVFNAPSTVPTIPATVTFTVNNNSGNVFNFGLMGGGIGGDVNLYSFLTHGGDTVSGINNTSGPGTNNINNGVMVFTGYTTLTAGTTYEFTHDDGMILYLTNSSGTTMAINSATPTASDISNFTVLATGTYSYEVIYAEVNGGPAVLNADIISSTTPEPSSLLLLGTGLLGLAFSLFRKNKPLGLGLHS